MFGENQLFPAGYAHRQIAHNFFVSPSRPLRYRERGDANANSSGRTSHECKQQLCRRTAGRGAEAGGEGGGSAASDEHNIERKMWRDKWLPKISNHISSQMNAEIVWGSHKSVTQSLFPFGRKERRSEAKG